MRALHRCVVLLFVLLCLPASLSAWVKNNQPPRTELNIVLDVFCRTVADPCSGTPGARPPTGNGPFTDAEWSQAISDAATQWANALGVTIPVNSRFHRSGETACDVTDAVVIILVEVVGGVPIACHDDIDHFPLWWSNGARYFPSPGAGRIYVNTKHGGGLVHLRRLLIHELGHALGLDHPDEHGQQVRAVMNADLGCSLGAESFRYCNSIQPDDRMGITALYVQTGAVPDPVGTLENPAPNSFQSGISVISGWLCEPGLIEIKITDPRDGWTTTQTAAYGTSRADTQTVCSDTNNGFGLTFNWNILGDGVYEVVATVDGVEFGRVTATVTTLGQEVLRGADGQSYVLSGFSRHGLTVTIEWSEALQNFVIVDMEP